MALDPSMPVLVVDDYGTMVRIIRNLLRQIGFADVDDAKDGTTALEKLHSRRYGLVISDWNMEPMTGYDLLRQVRADPGLGEIPFIMVTAESKTKSDANSLPLQPACHRERLYLGRNERRIERIEVRRLAIAVVFGVQRRCDKQAVDAERCGAFQIRTH